ncbi:MAG: hypothetical protein IKM22_03965 [Clostridia bacterium]|nr:hypothetical protein [Clostridia bacterium]
MLRLGKIFLALFICVLILTTAVFPVFAESSAAIAEESGSGENFDNPPMKEYTWVYILIAIVTFIGIIASAVYITKKVK